MSGGKPPTSIGINPTIAFFSIVLGGACAVAAYTEKYRRDQDEIDDRLKERFYGNMKEQQAKMPQITQTIRGQDVRLDDAMNKWVWGGKADLSRPSDISGGGIGGENTSSSEMILKSSEDDTSSSAEEEGVDSLSDSGSSSASDEELEEEKKLSKKERRQRRKERKLRREERRKKREEEKKRLEVERQKIMIQSVATGAAVGAVAVAVSMFLTSGKK